MARGRGARRRTRTRLQVLVPDLQVAFWHRLEELRDRHLGPALGATTGEIETPLIDRQLADYAQPEHLRRIASFGLRGEVFLPVPCILEARPCLLGYYRLLYGLSQKEFYSKGPFGRFKSMEEKDRLTEALAPKIPALCRSLVQTGQMLIDGLPQLSVELVHELQLLTLGPQLRGSWNTKLGQAATVRVFELIKRLVRNYATESTARTISLTNDSGRQIVVEFASDPDIRITEQAASRVLPLVSVEIKGGKDVSNIHNRIGEAEKSHQKARAEGFFEFWTILGATVSRDAAQRESPTTTHFFSLDQILDLQHDSHLEFCDVLASKIGIRIPCESR